MVLPPTVVQMQYGQLQQERNVQSVGYKIIQLIRDYTDEGLLKFRGQLIK